MLLKCNIIFALFVNVALLRCGLNWAALNSVTAVTFVMVFAVAENARTGLIIDG